MDIHCPKCGEPWDNDEFHYIAEDEHSTFREVLAQFTAEGCTALGGVCNPFPDTRRAIVAAIASELMGDDVDGIATMMDDAEAFGMFS